MIQCSGSSIQNIQPLLANSGRGFAHRGHYYDCLDNQNMKYALIQFGYQGSDSGLFASLCLPRSCSDKNITSSIDALFKRAGLPLSVFNIDSDTQNYQFPMNWLSYLTILILLLIAVALLVSTVRGSKQKLKNKWLQCFNISSNMKYFRVRAGEDLNIWDGVRAISMMWVVIGHSYQYFLAGALNTVNFNQLVNKPFALILLSGILSVDVFFTLGGFFLAFIMLRHKITLKTCGLGILQRALRIWPVYILTMMFFYSLVMRLGSGPFWSKFEATTNLCGSMWKDILFISNLIDNGKKDCLDWGWYLQVDFQLFIVCVFLLYLYTKKKVAYYISCGVLVLGSTVANMIVTYTEKVRVITDIDALIAFQQFTYDLYIKPYGRCTPYIMGLMLGVLFMEYRQQQKKKIQKEHMFSKLKAIFLRRRCLRILMEWIGMLLMFIVFILPLSLQQGNQWSQVFQSIYYTFSKPIFLFGMILVILPSILGISCSFFNLVLNAKVLTFIARVSFCTYLVHLIVIYGFILERTYDVYYDLIDIFVLYLGMLVICLFLGFIVTVSVQLPFANLLKLGMENLVKKQKNPERVSPQKAESLISAQSIQNCQERKAQS